MDETLLDAETWKLEAEAIINDVKDHVQELKISEKIKSTSQFIYLNLRTIEHKDFCVELSAQGFRIIGHNFDENNIDGDEYFETPYSLLNVVSPKFKESFGNALFKKLNDL
ncbi:GSK3-beta interaction protein-like [Anoplophora glabripennis]|uniref:GSK3-beta interaction protein-like n=1 Tax=Anoplophora glabripennis TaxID=217634 RepID=UPI00087411EB|nr:GSK3-beta interaction protein-like [Anoplophora glabripennis]